MKIYTEEKNNHTIAVVQSDQMVFTDARSALDFLMSVRYESECDRIAINKEAIAEDFFILSTGLAGEILQKFVNYRSKLAIYGDFSHYTSKPLKDFIYECNHGNDIFFTDTQEAAVDKLGMAQ